MLMQVERQTRLLLRHLGQHLGRIDFSSPSAEPRRTTKAPRPGPHGDRRASYFAAPAAFGAPGSVKA